MDNESVDLRLSVLSKHWHGELSLLLGVGVVVGRGQVVEHGLEVDKPQQLILNFKLFAR